ncbi:hypothetical protein RCH10_005521 [Variovorax sp. GrIS 2.14]
MHGSLNVGQKLLVLKFLKVTFPPRPSRSCIATSVDPLPSDKALAIAIVQWEHEIDRLHVIKS